MGSIPIARSINPDDSVDLPRLSSAASQIKLLFDVFQDGLASDLGHINGAIGADGYAAMGFPLHVAYPSEESFSIDPLLSFGGGYAYWNAAPTMSG